MSGKLRYAIDTSFAVAVLRGDLCPAYSMDQVAFPVAAVGELRFGALGASDARRSLEEVDAMVGAAVVLPADLATAHVYAQLRTQLKAAGTPLPENDIWIAATCLQHDLTLLTLDHHFERVGGLALQSR